jgi:hypothetical protein
MSLPIQSEPRVGVGDPKASDRNLEVIPAGAGTAGAAVAMAKKVADDEAVPWSTESLVALLDSTREEVRSFRTQLYGAVAAAFLLPAATIAVQTPDFLKDWYGGPGILAALSWSAGVAILSCGMHKLRPRAVKPGATGSGDKQASDKPASERKVVFLTELSLKHNAARELKECIRTECRLLDQILGASKWFFWATTCFVGGAGVEFISFVICRISHVHLRLPI